MITLCGFSVSNYYNKVKMVLLEKGIPFNEERVMTKSKDEVVLAASPLGKVPFIRTDKGTLCESQVIVDFLDAMSPQTPLTPTDPWEAAKVRELVTFIDLHLELVARELYAQAFFGGTVSEETRERVRKQLAKHIAGFKRLAKFSPYVAGTTFTQADCAAYVNLPLVAMASKAVLGEDLLATAGIDWKAYVKLIGERPSAQRVAADRKADTERMAAEAKAA
ncbi:MAG: glutathione S-transferase [Proteobacteria bacterium]|nr:glutathione S-transferase [Pseudomonadota bacterium]